MQYGLQHLGRGLEIAHRLAAGVERVLWVFKQASHPLTQTVSVCEQVDDDAGVEHQSHGRMIFCPSL